MAIFNQPSAPKRDVPAPWNHPSPPKPRSSASRIRRMNSASTPPAQPARPATAERLDSKESLIASDLTIEGKIEGAGHVRIAGRFKGDVHVQGDLTIEVGARVNGAVRARKVVIAGELEGNVESAQHVELLAGGVMIGDLKADTVIVAAGSRMKGQVEFGGGDKATAKSPTARRRPSRHHEHAASGHPRRDPHLPALQDHHPRKRQRLSVVQASFAFRRSRDCRDASEDLAPACRRHDLAAAGRHRLGILDGADRSRTNVARRSHVR